MVSGPGWRRAVTSVSDCEQVAPGAQTSLFMIGHACFCVHLGIKSFCGCSAIPKGTTSPIAWVSRGFNTSRAQILNAGIQDRSYRGRWENREMRSHRPMQTSRSGQCGPDMITRGRYVSRRSEGPDALTRELRVWEYVHVCTCGQLPGQGGPARLTLGGHHR